MKLNNNTLLPFESSRQEVRPKTIFVFGSDDGSCLRQGSDSEVGQFIDKDKRTVYERHLSLTADMDKIKKLGEALPLLLALIRKCGKGDTCVANYATLAEECQITASTIKNWGKKLEQLGFINKKNTGPNGLTFTLIDDVIGKSDVFQRIDQQLLKSAEQIRAAKVVAGNALNQALASVLFKTETIE